MLERIRFSRAALGSLASGSLLVNSAWPRFVVRIGRSVPTPEVTYLDEVVATVISIFGTTLAGPVVGTALTFLLVLAVMYQTFPRLQIRTTAVLYTTPPFRLLLTAIAGGFGIGWILFLGGSDSSSLIMTQESTVILSVGWLVVGTLSLGGFLAYSADPTEPGNPIVALLARIVGADPSAYRHSQVTESWVPTSVAVPVTVLAAGFILSFVAILPGLIVAIATLAYPLPEALVLIWILAQLIGLHRLPYLGWLKDIEVERRVYEKLGTGTVTYYGMVVGFSYLVVLSVGALMFDIVGLPVFIRGVDFLTGHVTGGSLVSSFSSLELATLFVLHVAFTVSPVITGLHWIAYWILAILRLPTVATFVLPDRTGDIEPAYRRLEGLTLPGSVLLIWVGMYIRVEAYTEPVTVQSLFIFVFVVVLLANGWTLFRAIWADLDPQPVYYEEGIMRAAAGVQAVSTIVAFVIAGLDPSLTFLSLSILLVGMVVMSQYFSKVLHTTAPDEGTSEAFYIALIGVCIVLVPVSHWGLPNLSPGPQILLIIMAGLMAVAARMDRKYH